MKIRVGALLLGAALVSLFAPRNARSKAACDSRALLRLRRMFALVQTHPAVCVLALSPDIDELEREMAELNETWNHCALRAERHRFEIQSAPVLTPSRAPSEQTLEKAAPKRSA